MLGTVFVSAFAIQMAFDSGSEKIWDVINKGRQWKDIKHRYVQAAEEEYFSKPFTHLSAYVLEEYLLAKVAFVLTERKAYNRNGG